MHNTHNNIIYTLGKHTMGKNIATIEDHALLFMSNSKYKGNGTLYGVINESMTIMATTLSPISYVML